MSRPHVKLTNTILEGKARETALEEAKESLSRNVNTIMIDDEAWITAEMIATGALSPCTGFMNAGDYASVLHNGRLADGTPWPTPLSFAVAGERNQSVLKGLQKGDVVTLIGRNKQPVARITTEEVFEYDREERAQCVFGTTDKRHPGVRSIYERMGDRSLAGKVEVINRPHWGAFEKYRLTPEQCIDYFYNKKGARTVVGFITATTSARRYSTASTMAAPRSWASSCCRSARSSIAPGAAPLRPRTLALTASSTGLPSAAPPSAS